MNTPEEEQAKDVNLEVLQPSAIEAIERAQVNVQVATAHRYPRSMKVFREGALAMATLDQETAESCCYVRPVGKKRDEKTGRMVQEYAEGASIRLAEIVAANYGNLRVASRIVEQTLRYVKCEGVAHDLQNNYAGKSESFEPTVTKDGNPYSEGMRAVVAKAALAKAYRDAVFKVVPRALCKPIYEEAKRVAAGQGQTIEKRRLKAQAWLASIKVEDARVFAALGITEWANLTDEHLTILTGLRTAIKDGDTTPLEAFPPINKAPEGFAGDKPTPASSPESEKPIVGQPEASPSKSKEEFKPNPAFSGELNTLYAFMHRDSVSEAQVVAWCQQRKLMNAERGQNSIGDLSTKKILDISKAWEQNVEDIKKMP